MLEILQESYDRSDIADTIEYFRSKLDDIASRYSHLFTHSVGVGLMLGLRAIDADIQQRVYTKSFEANLILLKAGRNTIRFLPPLIITKEEIDEGFKRFEKAITTI